MKCDSALESSFVFTDACDAKKEGKILIYSILKSMKLHSHCGTIVLFLFFRRATRFRAFAAIAVG